ncbi:Ribose ABC transporter permease [Pseudomonas coronafaciens pv. garcae]|uniref:Ribose ABC transporter permease n=4 Tax=Pseudomonas syringae group TaxID=136849 RepID=A0AB37QN55_9PSED|nr:MULTISPECIES: ABC transporter permease [Pseudomonas syringae group]KOP55326.1 branched-chain amino acid ABC transporter permease [Pseudomonas coronafaciens pv. porri]KOP56303.1 branched-chain amino acid ABC transporter permease [Pseudomonas coronafaciens pv. porri]KPY23325.1 Ribose ABC transporter permease [Pseudomonas coronafaciens pv. porri]MCQ3014245.1 ABC transporter permease [Pseudomonas tremae]QGL57178.1 ABC transporter permease [Pseudomonas coronafaciens pv. oryzae str. 1_6]
MSALTLNTPSTAVKVLPRLLPAVLPLLVLIILLFFAVNAPGFLSWGNLSSLVLNNFVLLAIVAIGMTWAVAAGGIDLSVGTALDFASLGFVVTLNAGYGLGACVVVALLAGVAAGAFNALLIAGLRISPFLATLGTLFIGTSVQQLLSDGGQPIYIAQGVLPGVSSVSILGVPLPLVVMALLASVYGLVLARGRLGREILAVGTQPQLAYYSGLPTRRIAALVFIGSALACSVAGILLSSTVNAYVPMSGNAYLINAIGAVFIGTTLSRQGRPNIAGTLLGVLLINVIANGLLLIGWNFYWQQVATGALIFAVLTFSFASRHLLRNVL